MNKAQLSSPTTLTAANHADGASYADGTNYADGAANTSDDDDWASFSKTAYGQILEQDPNRGHWQFPQERYEAPTGPYYVSAHTKTAGTC